MQNKFQEDTCKYSYKYGDYWKCKEKPLPYSEGGFCLFHEPNKIEKDCEKFKIGIIKKIKSGDHQFIGYVFPIFMKFGGVKFINANFNFSIFREGVNFGYSTFRGPAYFRGSIFQEIVDFNYSIFQETVDFSSSIFQESVDFIGTSFKGPAIFSSTIFQGSADFYSSIFYKNVYAGGTKFKKANFGEILYRAGKTFFHNSGNYRKESHYHILEMDAIRKQQKWFPRGWNFVFQKLLHSYGERPIKVFIFALFVILGFSFLFAFFGIKDQSINQIIYHYWTCLYYSVVTFTTLGYGDFQPTGITRIFAAIEALIGAFLMALFVVTFARRWRR